MARKWEDEIFEDDACLNCGATHFHESKVPGVCVDCASGKSWEDEDLPQEGMLRQK